MSSELTEAECDAIRRPVWDTLCLSEIEMTGIYNAFIRAGWRARGALAPESVNESGWEMYTALREISWRANDLNIAAIADAALAKIDARITSHKL